VLLTKVASLELNVRCGPGLINALLITLLVFVRVGGRSRCATVPAIQGHHQLATMNDR
jgi:hypothetical protein